MKILDKKTAQETAKLLLSIKAITLSPSKPYRYTSGMLSPIYIDNRIVISYPKIREKIVGFYAKVLDLAVGKDKIDYLSGTATAAVPHAMFIAEKMKKPLVYVEISKDENKTSILVGRAKKGKRAVVIEDHLTTGGSAVINALTLRRAGLTVKDCIVTSAYGMKQTDSLFEKNKIKAYCLTDINTILKVAVKEGYLKQSQVESVKDWISNPAGWGKKHGFE